MKNISFHIGTLSDIQRLAEMYLDDPDTVDLERVEITMDGQDFLTEMRENRAKL